MFDPPPAAVTVVTDEPAGLPAVLQPQASARCGEGGGEEIIVCGRRGESPYRIVPIPNPIAPRVSEPDLRFGINLGKNARIGGEAFQSALPDGKTGPGGRVRVRIPF